MKGGPVLVIPAFGEGRGGGHIARSAALVQELRALGREASLFLPYSRNAGDPRELLGEFRETWIIRDEEKLPVQYWEWILIDRFKTSTEEYDRWAALGPTIGIDEGGPARRKFDFLLDLLPGLKEASKANRTAPYLLPLPQNRKALPWLYPDSAAGRGELRILISFGAEDPAGLTLPATLAALPPRGGEVPVDITVIFGSLYGADRAAGAERELSQGGARVLQGMPNLKEQLRNYDLLITHFGLTAFEALAAGLSVCLVSPTKYHEKLAREAGFVSAGLGAKGAERLRGLIYGDPEKKALHTEQLKALGETCASLARKFGLDTPSPTTYGTLVGGFTPLVSLECPVCGDKNRHNHPVLARFPEKTYRRCANCGMVYMLRLNEPPIEYDVDYFFESYRRQYGKTYLDDFPNLKKTGKLRLRRIRKILPQGDEGLEKRLLDIGCAYGPFLAAAAEGGFSPMGIDPAEDAIRYVTEKLNIPAVVGFYPSSANKEIRREAYFDAVTLWYVIEHFTKPQEVLREIHRILKPGGVLAFSTPSFSGVSGRKSSNAFLELSPEDHWTVLDPRNMRKILDRFGFELKRIVTTGHHPERFPLIGPKLSLRTGILYRLVYEISRLCKLGDTCEVYAVKR